jgi:dTDP-D-glucose 4,6-dehydratase
MSAAKMLTLGWKPSITLRDGLAQTYAWFLASRREEYDLGERRESFRSIRTGPSGFWDSD